MTIQIYNSDVRGAGKIFGLVEQIPSGKNLVV
jgi:hypothetical protein